MNRLSLLSPMPMHPPSSSFCEALIIGNVDVPTAQGILKTLDVLPFRGAGVEKAALLDSLELDS